MNWESLRLKYNKYKRKIMAKKNSSKISDGNFTIISNNCWGGMIYESYNLPKNSPTVGLYFMPKDYIKFLKNLKEYVSVEIEFIEPSKSKYEKVLKKDHRFGKYPIGKLKDIEIMFLHYKSKEEAREKWNRRCKRINWNKLLIKFNDQNGCTEEEVYEFYSLPYKNKLFFTVKDWDVKKVDGYYKIKQYTSDDYVTASHEPWGKNSYVNLEKIINNL